MPIALFIMGPSGAGKTRLAKRFIKNRLRKHQAWALLDKDTTGEVLAPALMRQLGLDPDDRDSPAYQTQIRDLEYEACLRIAAEQLRLGLNVVLPGPWTKELNSGRLFDAKALGFPKHTRLVHVYLDANAEALARRIVERQNPRDAWKLAHWETFTSRLGIPVAIPLRAVPVLMSDSANHHLEQVVSLCRAPN